MNKLFDSYSWNFNSTGLGGLRSKDHSSKYGTGLATMHDPTVKAILLYVFAEKEKAGLGKTDKGIIAEISKDTDTRQIVSFCTASGRYLACNYSNGVCTPYKLGKSNEDGTALLFAIMPVLLDDEEFEENMKKIGQFSEGYNSISEALPELVKDEQALNAMFVLNDNAYRRIERDSLCVISNTGSITALSDMAVSQGIYVPAEIIKDGFTVLTASQSPSDTVDASSFGQDYILDPDRVYSQTEQALIPELPGWYIVPKYLVSACRMTKANLSRPVRNIMFRGEAGTGKTEAAKAMAAALRLPYVSICCHPDMGITDFTGTILPKLKSTPVTTGELPSFEDIEMDAAYAFSMLTGEEAPEGITADDVLKLLIDKAAAARSDSSLQYEYCDSELVRAIRYGWLCEIQEPAIIERPGVLTGLNSLLDTCQQVTLPTGEVIKRHPDCVIVVTTNTSYQGCKEINNSVISRMQFKQDTELPSDDELKKRILGITGFTDDDKLSEMIKVVKEIHTFCQERMITDGSCGVRELIDWVNAYMVLGSITEAAECTVIPSASADSESQQEIKVSCLAPHFAE